MPHIPPGERIYDLKGLERFETAGRRDAEEKREEVRKKMEEANVGWENLSKHVDGEERVKPEREAELEEQYDEEAEIQKERERLQLVKDLTEGGNGSREVGHFERLGKDVSEGKRPSAREPF